MVDLQHVSIATGLHPEQETSLGKCTKPSKIQNKLALMSIKTWETSTQQHTYSIKFTMLWNQSDYKFAWNLLHMKLSN